MSLHVSIPSTPELIPSAGPSTTIERTNTLVITGLPDPYLEPDVLDALQLHFTSYGQIYKWAPVRGLARVILVYHLEEDAEQAKEHCDNLVVGPFPDLPQFTMRVYRNDPTIIDLPDGEEGNYYLRPPAIEKNFLISPPGSPPVGWEQIREDPPNATPLATDLMAALNKLHLQQGPLNESGFEVLIEPDEGETGIGIYVEDCDHRRTKDEPAERDWVYGQPSPGRPMWKPAPTAMPAMRVGA